LVEYRPRDHGHLSDTSSVHSASPTPPVTVHIALDLTLFVDDDADKMIQESHVVAGKPRDAAVIF